MSGVLSLVGVLEGLVATGCKITGFLELRAVRTQIFTYYDSIVASVRVSGILRNVKVIRRWTVTQKLFMGCVHTFRNWSRAHQIDKGPFASIVTQWGNQINSKLIDPCWNELWEAKGFISEA